ncbi:MAG: hypothetical protein E7496_12610 [Ruminococcus sp.]|nr:hypothetical protein [Ruminococcus sp.]
MSNNLWHEGTIGVPKKHGGYTVVHYWAKVYDEPSEYGIEKGRISKAMLKQNGKIVYNFDRGLDVTPQTEEAEMALAILLKEYS